MSYDISVSGYNANKKFARWKEVNPDEIMLGFEYEIDDNNLNESVFEHNGKEYVYAKPTPWKTLPKNYTVVPEGWMFEVQSPVCPLRIHSEVVPDFLNETTFNMKTDINSNRGGIHINIEKTYFTNRLSNSVFSFMHNPKYWKLFSALSKRDNESLSRWSNQNTMLSKKESLVDRCQSKTWVITSHKLYAYELRLFKAVPDLLLPALEWGDSLFMAAEAVSKELTWDNWRKFVSDKPQYKTLNDYLLSKSL